MSQKATPLLHLTTQIFTKIDKTGTIRGYLRPELCKELGLSFLELNINFPQFTLEKLNIEVILVDERLTTVFAQNQLIFADVSRKKRKEVIDKMAAVVVTHLFSDLPHHKVCTVQQFTSQLCISVTNTYRCTVFR